MTLSACSQGCNNVTYHLRKIGSIIRSIEEKSWKTDLLSYNETSASFGRKTTPPRETECYKMKQLSIRRSVILS